MVKKGALGVLIVLIAFLGFVSTRESRFQIERSGLINAPAEAIYPYLSNFEMGHLWSPYEKIDPNMKKQFSGVQGQAGSVMEFDGNSEAGSGKLELLNLVPNKQVNIKLTMTKPFAAENLILYTLTPEGSGTRFSWMMSGDGGFMGKLISLFIDCDKMVGEQFTTGIENLKAVVEAKK